MVSVILPTIIPVSNELDAMACQSKNAVIIAYGNNPSNGTGIVYVSNYLLWRICKNIVGTSSIREGLSQ